MIFLVFYIGISLTVLPYITPSRTPENIHPTTYMHMPQNDELQEHSHTREEDSTKISRGSFGDTLSDRLFNVEELPIFESKLTEDVMIL